LDFEGGIAIGEKTKRGWIANLFPVEHDFLAMLTAQAEVTKEGMASFAQWLERGEDRLALAVLERSKEADAARLKMEGLLVEAFSTPIDRGDLYEVSRQLDLVFDYARDTVREAAALAVLPPQPFYARFGEQLAAGTASVTAAIGHLADDPAKSEMEIPAIRDSVEKVRETYFDTLSEVALEANVNVALRRREIYHHLKDAGVMLDRTTDILHRIIVRVL
jgi:uncharacterized protein